jgi:hypothetical protein
MLAATPPPEWPGGTAAHVAGCRECSRAVAGARLVRGIVAVAAEGAEPRPGFAGRVMATLGATRRAGEAGDLWRPAWALLPAFGSVVAVLLALLVQSSGGAPAPPGWPALVAPSSVTERLVFGPGATDQDEEAVLMAVLESR